MPTFAIPSTEASTNESALVRAATPVGFGSYYRHHLPGAVIPLLAGLALFGWAAIAVAGVVVLMASAATLLWRGVGARGRSMRVAQTAWMALLLAMMLPAEWGLPTTRGGWALAASAGLILAAVTWLLGSTTGRVHPAVVSFMLLASLFPRAVEPHSVLRQGWLFTGDLHHAVASPRDAPAWFNARAGPDDPPAYTMVPAAERLTAFGRGEPAPTGTFLNADGLLREWLPPLEDLLLGGHPTPLGQASAAVVIAGGLVLLYRGLIDHRVPLYATGAFFVAMLVLPTPMATDDGGAVRYQWLTFRDPLDGGLGPAKATLLAAYHLAAGPMLFAAFFLATTPTSRPMARRARVVYAAAWGIGSAALQLYYSVATGPYLALLLANLLSPTLDRFFRPRTLV